MVEFRGRLFPQRSYRLPLRWIMLIIAAGLFLLLVWVTRQILR